MGLKVHFIETKMFEEFINSVLSYHLLFIKQINDTHEIKNLRYLVLTRVQVYEILISSRLLILSMCLI